MEIFEILLAKLQNCKTESKLHQNLAVLPLFFQTKHHYSVISSRLIFSAVFQSSKIMSGKLFL
jgi:hypothetical protein